MGQTADTSAWTAVSTWERKTVLGVAIVFTLSVSGLVAAQAWSIGVKDQWVWPYSAQPAMWPWAAVGVVPLALWVAVFLFVWRRERVGRAEEAVIVLFCVAFAIAMMYCTPLADPLPFWHEAAITSFPWMGGYYAQSLSVGNVCAYLRDYAAFMRKLSVKGVLGHIADHPPGPELLHALANAAARVDWVREAALAGLTPEHIQELHQLMVGWVRPAVVRRARVLGLLPRERLLTDAELAGAFVATHSFRILAALTVAPVYFLARRRGGVRAGVAAAGLCGLIPSLHSFSPFLDQVFCIIAAASMLTWLAALERRSFRLSLLTGVLLFLGLQLTLAFLVVAAMAAAATPLHALAARRSGERPVRLHEAASLAGGALLGVLAPALGLQLWSGYDSLEVWYLCYAKHAGFSGQFGRTYWPWFLMNPVEMFVFMGAPVSALTAWAACRDMPNLWRPGTRPETLLWAFVLIMALLHVSGKNLGEVARLWMFVMPLAAAVAGCALSRLDRRHGLAAAACVAVLYVQTVVFRVSLETLALP